MTSRYAKWNTETLQAAYAAAGAIMDRVSITDQRFAEACKTRLEIRPVMFARLYGTPRTDNQAA